MRTNLVLIGLPAAGKSTLGVLLAKRLSLDFLDTDVFIQAREGRRLQDILDLEGRETFRRVEDEAVLSLARQRTVIATGGSVVYGERAMAHLHAVGRVVYLYLPMDSWRARLRDFGSRGVVCAPGQSLESLYDEREPLYRRWAEAVVDASPPGHEEAVERIVAALGL